MTAAGEARERADEDDAASPSYQSVLVNSCAGLWHLPISVVEMLSAGLMSSYQHDVTECEVGRRHTVAFRYLVFLLHRLNRLDNPLSIGNT